MSEQVDIADRLLFAAISATGSAERGVCRDAMIEIDRLRKERLTNEERSAIAWAAAGLLNDADETWSRGLRERSKHSRDAAETLKRLLERQAEPKAKEVGRE